MKYWLVTLIEHLPMHRAPEILTKWKDALKPEGKLVIETPDLEAMCKEFIESKDKHNVATLVYLELRQKTQTTQRLKKKVRSLHICGATHQRR
jgi:predicted SAM-dependent methyltransferase